MMHVKLESEEFKATLDNNGQFAMQIIISPVGTFTAKTKCWQICILPTFILMHMCPHCASNVPGISIISVQLTGLIVWLSSLSVCANNLLKDILNKKIQENFI